MVIGRDAGTAGRLLRLLAGAVLVAGAVISLATRHDAALAFQVLLFFGAQFAVHLAMLVLLGDRVLARVDPWIATFILYLPSITTGALGASGMPILRPVATIASALYVGAGLVVMSATGYGGCEVISIANVVLRRRQLMYCPFNAVDLAERAARIDRRRALAFAAGAAALLIGGTFVLLEDSGPMSEHVRLPSIDRHWALLLLAPAASFATSAALRARRGGRGLDDAARVGALGAAALALAAGALSGLLPQRVIWPLILFGGTILALIRALARRRN